MNIEFMTNKKKHDFEVGKTLKSYQPADTQAPAETPALTPGPRRRRGWRGVLRLVVLLLLGAVLVISAWDAINLSKATKATFGSGNFLNLLTPSSIKEQNGRTNILLVGYSIDDPGHPGASLTDSIMLLSLSTTGRSGYMLSIPRDLYVKIPGFGYGKINEAYKDGGVETLASIVSEKFNTPVDYYALINYAAVRDSVNALGGVTVDIKSPDPRGLYDTNISPVDGGPLILPNGPQQLDGQTALNLSRARGDGYGSYGFPQADFDRTEHQRQILLAIKERLGWGLVLNPLSNGRLFDGLGKNVITDIKIHEARPLFSLINRADSAHMDSYSLRNLKGVNYLTSYVTYSGGSALVPTAGIDDYSQIIAALAQINKQ